MISPKLHQFIHSLPAKFDGIPTERKRQLEKLSDFIEDRLEDDFINLTFICVHNSRRSHLSQVWAQVAANHYGLNKVQCYSGGTEVTCLFPYIIDALKEQGLQCQTVAAGSNPIYAIKYSEDAPAIIGFSKYYDNAYNPQNGFMAVMVCSTADSNCPYVAHAGDRVLLPFDDPKEFDNTPEKNAKYLERSEQIATELFYAFSRVKE